MPILPSLFLLIYFNIFLLIVPEKRVLLRSQRWEKFFKKKLEICVSLLYNYYLSRDIST